MQLSARNQINGVVEHIDNDNVNSQIFVKLNSGYTLICVITNSACSALDLQIGDRVVSIFKSSSVLITTDITLNISARNKFQGTITQMNMGLINAEIVVDIGGQDYIVAVITVDAIKALGLKLGDEVSGVIKASDVILGK